MYIKSVILDGFKSYGRRTEVHGFDPEFTAITGLNGSGKSNILDSICFVLGINNLTQVRVASLNDLVFKSGQSGITKATVTLVFDNTDPGQCPLGYEKCREISVTRQIVVGGKNKYLINGKNVPNKKVTDLFCSVQLNVNNPSFLIMQGRITKVLNMKPNEILSMIEEAAGTSMYQTKREATTKLIEKKEAKVRETDALLAEEVEPKLEKLRQERAAHSEYQKLTRDIDFLTRIYISYKYLKQKKSVENTEIKIQGLEKAIEDNKSTIVANEEEILNIDQTTKDIQHKIDTESGGELNELENQLSKFVEQEAKSTGELKASQSAIQQDEKKLKLLSKSIKDDEDALATKEAQMGKVEGLFQTLKEADERDSKAYEASQKKFDAVSQGLSTNEDGTAATLQDQLIAAKQQISEAQTTVKTSDMELRHCRTVLKQKEGESQTSDATYLKDKKMHDQITNEINRINTELASINYEDGLMEKLDDRRLQLSHEIRQLQQQLDKKNAYRYEMQYRDPEPNFDRSKVRGMVGKLFSVKDPKNYLALTMCAGGHLYSQVTTDDVTSKKILQKGQLQNRVTIIPMNKITSRAIDDRTIEYAKQLVGAENVDGAANLVSYDRYYDPVMKFVFGHSMICKDLETARKVTFNRDIHCRSVTLDGDVVDPEGTLTGGSRPKGGNVLLELAEIKRIENEMYARKKEIQQIDQQLATIEQVARKYNSLKERLELRQCELNACSDRLAQTTFQQNQDEINGLKEKIATLEQDLLDAREKQKTATAKVKDIEAKLSDAKGYRERELKSASDEMKAAKKKSEQSLENWKKREQEFETLRLEIEELRKGNETARKQFEEMSENVAKLKADLDGFKSGSNVLTDKVNDMKSKIKEQKEKINSQNKELRGHLSKKSKLGKEIQDLTLDIKKKENEVTKVRSENSDNFARIEALEDEHTWIKEDKEFFGNKNTRYDYTKENPDEAGRKLSKLTQQRDKMQKNLNFKALLVLDREEEQYREMCRRKQIVAEDKKKIENIIHKMDEKKKEKVEKAWTEVNKNFSGIFSTLLPGAQACLRATMASGSLQGLEIRVGFSGVWKDSLSELSGGQRSLVALSLVLAMLKFSPAPLYILDEVDAALDMSHTQNIGQMLKTHFTNSQFIIVSLKDGMFSNANVLFRTKFEDGVSCVGRTDNRSRNSRK